MAERRDSQQDNTSPVDSNVLTDGDRSAVPIHLSRSVRPISPRNEEIISLHPSVSTPRVPEPHGMDQYWTYEERLQTFANWPVTHLAPEVLSEALFIYTGYGDKVKCVKCGNQLSNWQLGEDPSQKHLNHFRFVCNSSR